MLRTRVSWVSLWQPLLREAVESCLVAQIDIGRRIQAAASSVVLARTSWDAFANELIEQREIDQEIKALGLRRKIEGIYRNLGEDIPNFVEHKIWNHLMVANQIRNAIVHQRTTSLSAGDSPANVLQSLQTLGVISRIPHVQTWEDQVLCADVARWCCYCAAQGIVTLEELPVKQFRSPSQVRSQIDEIYGEFQRRYSGWSNDRSVSFEFSGLAC